MNAAGNTTEISCLTLTLTFLIKVSYYFYYFYYFYYYYYYYYYCYLCTKQCYIMQDFNTVNICNTV